MPIRRLFLASALTLIAAACGSDARDSGTGDEPVPLWSADSRRTGTNNASTTADTTADDGVAAVVAVGSATPEIGAPQPAAPAPPAADAQPSSGTNANASAEQAPQQSSPATAGSAEEILLRAERAYDAVRTMRASFTQELTVPLLNSTHHSRGDLYHRKPDRFAMRFTDPAGDLVVADGTSLWAYYPSTDAGQVLRGSSGEAGGLDLQREFLSNPTERFNATLEGTETVAGRDTHRLSLIPRSPAGYSSVRIWIDTQDFLARRFEVVESNENIRRVELHDLRTNVDLPEGVFNFTPPPNAQIFEQ